MKILAFGDIHEHIERIAEIKEIPHAICVIITGDLTNVGGIARVKRVIDFVRQFNPVVFAQAGNFDRPEVETYLVETGISLHGNGFVKDHIGLFGIGGSNKTPFGTPNELDEDEMASLILRGFQKVKASSKKIFISHAPPFNTAVDIVTSGQHVGSRAVRTFIENYQPEICITGHIHEARGEDRIGSTVILNPGPIQNGGYVEISEENGLLHATLKNI